MTAGKIPDSETAPDFGESSTWNIPLFIFSDVALPDRIFKIREKIQGRPKIYGKKFPAGFAKKRCTEKFFRAKIGIFLKISDSGFF